MENSVWNQKSGRRVKTEQNTDTYPTGEAVGGRSSNLVKLIGADNVSRRNFKYEGTIRGHIGRHQKNRSKWQFMKMEAKENTVS